MATNAHIYFKNGTRAHDINYKGLVSIKAGCALQVLGKDDCKGNGIPESAPVITLFFDDGTQATFDADNVTVLF